MAWYKRYIIPFKSRLGTDYAVYIFETSSGTLTRLTGAPDTFTTRENDDDDVFTPIRSQSGYIRIIDSTGGTLIEALRPDSNTEKKVELWSGTWNNASGTFTDGSLQWRGFLSTDAFTQPWDNHAHVLELAVNSVLGVLTDVQMSESSFYTHHNIAYLLYHAFDTLGAAPSYVYTATDLTVPRRDMMSVLLQYQIFCETADEYTGADLTTKVVGMSYGEAISEVLGLYGLTAREYYGRIYLVQSNLGSVSNVSYWSWSQMESMALGNIPSTYSGSIIDGGNLLSVLSFRSTENTQGYVSGAKKVVVELQLDDRDEGFSLPNTTEDASTVHEVSNIYSGRVFVQPHSPRSNSIETFTFSEYQQVGQSGSNRVDGSTYAKCLANCVINRPLYDPHYSSSDNLHTGAFPCRWYYKKEDTESPSLKNGLFLNQQYLGSGWSFTPYYCYSLKSESGISRSNGFLNINMLCHNFMRGSLAGDSDKLYFGEFTTIWSTKPQTKLYFILTWGNKEWNGSEWITHSGDYTTFSIDFDGASVKTNKTSAMNVDGNDGWFVPITESMSGVVRLYILNVGSCETELGMQDAHSRIISDLEVSVLPVSSMVESGRSVNRYSQVLTTNGFTDEKEKYLIIGTNDNNKFSCSFIKSDESTFIETLSYSGGNFRPEAHLLGRMASQYGSVRRTYTGIVESDVCNPLTYYTHDGKTLIPIDQNHNWRDDEQEVKFIEVG